MNNYLIQQVYDSYGAEAHETWRKLVKRHMEYNYKYASKEYKDGFKSLNLDKNKIVRIDELSETLGAISGWSLIPVNGLIPTRDFFFMIINKKYPVTVLIREPYEIDFSSQPDIFHDVFGHVPLLTSEKFYRFLTEFSTLALKYIDDELAVEELGRLYWYTYEMGVIYEDGELMSYGGAILTSNSEVRNVYNKEVPKLPFNVEEIFRTPYDPFQLQKKYFAIDNFDDLFNCMSKLQLKLEQDRLHTCPEKVLSDYPINKALRHGLKNTILFLNDIQYRYPDAISFAAGQPDESLFDVDGHIKNIETFIQYQMERSGKDRAQVVGQIAQYGRTKGMINELIARYLKKDCDIRANAEDIVMTVGAQEAFAIIISALVDRERDIMLVEEPGYIGPSGFATLFGYQVDGVRMTQEGIDLDILEEKIRSYTEAGKRVKLVYVIPDFQNPLGVSMPVLQRLKLLDLAERYNFLIVEDSVYNTLTYTQTIHPTIKSLDRSRRVIFVGSFSKSLFPGLRLGYIVADQQLEDINGGLSSLSDEFAKVKAQITNNTSGISQAIAGAVLLRGNGSLSQMTSEKFNVYKRKRDKIAECLHETIGRHTFDWATGISYNIPDGGFFIRVKLPFIVSNEDVVECARDFKMIFSPMEFFYLGPTVSNEIRLTFSNLTPEQIEEGISKFSEFLRKKTAQSVLQEVQLAVD
ncbi:MAG TPA: aminotransferase class I/II-fold pyridoxal phosphate-dependent enzyme [Puia sp.]|nr:aminotransferase class I/II-fold pyridoxal phosphate-dependent enzyme [Puia sp.]